MSTAAMAQRVKEASPRLRSGLGLRLLLLVLVLVLLALVACTAGPNTLQNTAGSNDAVAGFWRGLWHGFICLFTLVGSAFSHSVTIYEVHNNGGWYNLGFVFGVLMFFGGGGAGSKGRGRIRRCA